MVGERPLLPQRRIGAVPGTPQLLRELNEWTLLEQLWRLGPTSRSRLSRLTGLSKPTVSLGLLNLEDAGLVKAAGEARTRGRVARLYEANAGAGHVVGVDIGRTWVRCAVADLAGAVGHRLQARNTARTGRALLQLVGDLARDTVAAAGLGWDAVVHVAVGGPGVGDGEDQARLLTPNLPQWSRPGLVGELREALGTDTAVDNDANLAAVGERMFGCGRGVSTFVYVHVGTGVGMGVIIDGQLYTGYRHAAGEVAYLPLQPGADRDRRGGGQGPFEEAASAAGIARRAAALGGDGRRSSKAVFDAARAGEDWALEVVRGEGELLAHLVAAVMAILDPELVVFGGGVGSSLDLLGPHIERTLQCIVPFQPRLSASELGEEAIVLGAIASGVDVARQHVFAERAAPIRRPGLTPAGTG